MLSKRILSAVLGVIYLILILYVSDWLFNISVLCFSIIGMYEFYNAFHIKGYHPLQWIGYLILVCFFVLLMLNRDTYFIVVFIFAIITVFSISIFYRSVNIVDAMITITGIVYPGLAFFVLILLEGHIPHYQNYLLILSFLTTWSTDTFAYFTGLHLGKNKLIPSISPNKTVEGSIGGLLGSILVGAIAGWIISTLNKAGIGSFHFIFIGLISGIFSQLGDLSASAIKRHCGIKDFGKLLPGHGGLLDRFDSLLFSAPMIYCYYLIFLAP